MDMENNFAQQPNQAREGITVITLLCTLLIHFSWNIIVSHKYYFYYDIIVQSLCN